MRTSYHSSKYRPSPTYKRVTFWMVQRKSSFVQDRPAHTWWYLHLVEGTVRSVRKFMCTSWFDSYASSSLAAGRVTHAGQILSEMLDKEKQSIPWPSRLGVGCGDSHTYHSWSSNVSKPQQWGRYWTKGPKKMKKKRMRWNKKEEEEAEEGEERE